MAIVPMGMANNVSRSLGIGVDPDAAIRGIAHAKERHVDLGIVQSTEAKAYFLEGSGGGVFAYVVGQKATRKTRDYAGRWRSSLTSSKVTLRGTSRSRSMVATSRAATCWRPS